MKIAFVNDVVYGYASAAPVVGGAERQQWLLARALAARGWRVTVGVRTGLEPGERTSIDGVSFVGIDPGPIQRAWYRFLKMEHPDWWYWRCANHLFGMAVEIAKLADVRTIFAAAVDSDVEPRRALYRRPRWWPLYAWGLWRTDRIFVQHSGQLSTLDPGLRRKADLVPSIAGELADAAPHAERAGYIAWAAMLRRTKRPDLLLEIARRIPAVHFKVCGGPTAFASSPHYTQSVVEELRKQPNVEYFGRLAPVETRQIIAGAAVLLSTSDAEGFPNTFLEAWGSGTPVVSLRIDPDSVIERFQLGTVAGTVPRAADEIQHLLASPERRQAMAAAARRYVLSAHSEAAVTSVVDYAVARRV